MIRTVVINLARSTVRRSAIESRLNQLQIPFSFVDGVDGQQLSGEQKALYSPRAAFSEIGREMHPNEMGCLLSHIQIWKSLVASGEAQLMVIEDDMLIDKDFPDLVRNLDWIPGDAHVVNFSWDMANPTNLVPISATRFLCRFDRPVMRTGSYVIRRAGAEALLASAFPIRMPVDSLMGEERSAGAIYGVTPRPVRWDESLPTEIWTDTTMQSFSNSSRNTLKGFAFRLLNRIRS